MTLTSPSLQQYLESPLSIGDPDIAGPLTAFPLFGPEPKLEYLTFAQGVARGVTVHELQGGASVNDLTIRQPHPIPLSFFTHGEEVLGAQQNRTFDVSILVGAGSKLDVPVSCVEHGRWEGLATPMRSHQRPRPPTPSSARWRIVSCVARLLKSRHGGASRAGRGVGRGSSQARADGYRLADRGDARHLRAAPRDGLAREICDRIGLREGQIGTLVAIARRVHSARPRQSARTCKRSCTVRSSRATPSMRSSIVPRRLRRAWRPPKDFSS